MDALDLLKKRLNALGGNQEGRMKKEKLKTLEKALLYSEQAETVTKDGVSYRVILNKNKQKMDYDDKNISAPFECGFKTGDIFLWEEEQSNWIIYLREGQDAYFTGVCRRALYDIRWKDEYGVIRKTKGAVRGPVETKVDAEQKSGLIFENGNYTLYLLIPNNEHTVKLKRHSEVSIEGEMWKVAVTNSISEPGVIEVQLVEDYTNRDEDMDLVGSTADKCEFVPNENIQIVTSIDEVEALPIDESFELWAIIKNDGEEDLELTKACAFSVDTTLAALSNNSLTPLKEGVLEVTLKNDKLCLEKKFSINILNAPSAPIKQYKIVGDSAVKSLGENEYSISSFIDGMKDAVPSGKWVVEKNGKLFSIVNQTDESITLKWKSGAYGQVVLKYEINSETVAEKNIKVASLI